MRALAAAGQGGGNLRAVEGIAQAGDGRLQDGRQHSLRSRSIALILPIPPVVGGGDCHLGFAGQAGFGAQHEKTVFNPPPPGRACPTGR